MLRSLNSGVSGMQQFQEGMDVIGNNIANVNTVGFKGARVDFADTLSQTMGSNGSGGSIQVGTGVTTAAITNQFTQGAINNTGTAADLAMDGNGFFIVKDPNTGASYVTRAGNFHVDSAGFLTTSGGLRLQGALTPGTPVDPTVDLKVDTTGAPAASLAAGATVASFHVDTGGKIQVTLTDGAQYYSGQVLLQNFSNPNALVKQGNNLYSNIASAGALATPAIAQNGGLGVIVGGALESSNVDLANEFANMITTQRGFQANARVITTSDEILQELVNLKR